MSFNPNNFIEEVSIPQQTTKKVVHFPKEYLSNPNGTYKVLITSWVIERGVRPPHIPKLTLEVLPLSAFEINTEGERTELELAHKGRFPVCFAMDLNYYPISNNKPGAKINFVKAITGGDTMQDFLDMFNKLKGKQVILQLEKITSKFNNDYLVLKTIKPVSSNSPLPKDYDDKLDGSVILKGMTEEENWINLIPTSEWSNVRRDAVLPDSDYIYLIPRDNAGGITTWAGIENSGAKFTTDKFFKFDYKFRVKHLRLMWICKSADTQDDTTEYPQDLDQRVKAFEDLGLKPVSKEWLWNVIKSGGSAYNAVDQFFKDNMPNLIVKK